MKYLAECLTDCMCQINGSDCCFTLVVLTTIIVIVVIIWGTFCTDSGSVSGESQRAQEESGGLC